MSRWDITLTGVAALLGMFGMIAAAIIGHAEVSSSVLLLVVMYIIATPVSLYITDTLSFSFSVMFAVITAVVLSPADAALAFLMIRAIGFFAYRPSEFPPWQVVVGSSGFYFAGYGAMLAATAYVRGVVGIDTFPAVALVVTVASAVSDLVCIGLLMWIYVLDERTAAKLANRRPSSQLPLLREYVGELVVPLFIQVPMVIVGVFAWSADPYAIVLLIVPVLATWYGTRQSQQIKDAERRAKTDALTGMSNRAAFFECCSDELERAERFGHGLALIMGDLDNFKRVNDSHGHLAGDAVLRATAGALRSAVEESRYPLARYGGEEFVIAVPATSSDEVERLAELVRASVEEVLSDWGTSISLGVAFLQPHERMESLIDRADKALYSAKFAGKNRVHVWSAQSDAPVPSVQDRHAWQPRSA